MSREEAIIKVLKKAYFIEVAKYYYWVAHKATVENYKGCIPTEAKIHKLMDGKSARGTKEVFINLMSKFGGEE